MGHSVLIVDDDKELRTVYRMILEKAGYTVYEAANGAEALKFMMNQTPDILVMDMLMPMLGGEAVMQRVRQMPALKKMRIVVLTAYPRFRESALDFRADEFLVKPITPESLIQGLASVINSNEAVD